MHTPSPSTTVMQPTIAASNHNVIVHEGVIAGTIAAVTLAAWFLILDLIQGRPLFTPMLLGTVLFQGLEGIATLETAQNSHDVVSMVVGFTFVHWLVFMFLGLGSAKLLGAAERNPNLGFGILLLFVLFEGGFLAAMAVLAAPVLQALSWHNVVVGNLLAAGGMGLYFWRRHAQMIIHP